MLKMMKNIKESLGDGSYQPVSLFVFPKPRRIRSMFSAALEANGWQEYKLAKEAGQWIEDPALDPGEACVRILHRCRRRRTT
jgi:hypothetical protein